MISVAIGVGVGIGIVAVTLQALLVRRRRYDVSSQAPSITHVVSTAGRPARLPTRHRAPECFAVPGDDIIGTRWEPPTWTALDDLQLNRLLEDSS